MDADVDEQAALDLARHEAGDDVSFLVLLDDRFPFLLPFRLAITQYDGAGLVFHGVEQDFDLVALLRRHELAEAFVVPFAQLDGAFALVADVHPNHIGGDFADAAGDDSVVAELLFFGRQPVGAVQIEGRIVQFLF